MLCVSYLFVSYFVCVVSVFEMVFDVGMCVECVWGVCGLRVCLWCLCGVVCGVCL